jgi:uncharacterized protein (DUF427 family)
MAKMPESVWDYPRPPRVERSSRLIRVVLGGGVLAETERAHRVAETSHPPVYYIPFDDVRPGALVASDAPSTFCEFKGVATYHDAIGADGALVRRAGWSYPDPAPGFEAIMGSFAFFPGLMDECTVDGERALPQPGGFYGGWITSDVTGPFKGGPGTLGW